MTQLTKLILLTWGLLITFALGAAELKSAAITPDLLYQALNDQNPPLLVDIRSPDEYSSGHIPQAINIPMPLLAKRLSELKQAGDLVLYCNDSRLTRMAERILLRKKFKDFKHLGGGYKAWSETNLPIETRLE